MDAMVPKEAEAKINSRFVYRGARRQHVAFPLGGIGTGTVSLTGSGRLIDWSIRNRPAIHQHNGYSHFAIKAERDGKLIDARVLNGPYEGLPTGSPSRRKFDGFGFGANCDSMAGAPHFDDATFIGRFPVAEIALHRDAFPGQVRMTAFSPFIPHNERDLSMPAALFAFEVENDTDAAIDYTIACTLGNYGCNSGVHVFSRSGDLSGLHFTSADVYRPPAQRGDLAITTQGDGVEHVDYHVRGQWFDSLSRYWREFAKAGPLTERCYDQPRATAQMCSSRSTARSHGAFALRPESGRRCASPLLGIIRSARSIGSAARSRATRNMPAIRRRGATIMRRNGRICGPAAQKPSADGASSKRRPAPFAISCSAPRTRPKSSTLCPAHLACCAARPLFGSKARALGLGRSAYRRGLL